MNIKDITKKLVEGKPLSDEEKAFVESYDPDAATRTAVDAAAAAARRDAEAKLQKATADLKAATDAQAALQAKVKEFETNAGKLGGEASEAIRILNEKMAKLEKDRADAIAAQAKMVRETRISKLIEKAKLKYVDGVDVTEVNGSLARKLDSLDDDALAEIESADSPDKAQIHGHIFSKHRETWKGVIADESGGGSGGRPAGSRPSRMSNGVNPWKSETKNLTDQISIMNSDPQKAAQLMAEAGVKPPPQE